MVQVEVAKALSHQVVRRLAFIELNAVLMVIAAVALVIFGTRRRRCSNAVCDKIQWISYCLVTTLLFTLTIGQMQGAPLKNGLFAVWGMILLITTAADCSSACSPDDDEQWKRYNVQILCQYWLVGILLAVYVPVTVYVWIILALAILFTNEKTAERALKMATKFSLAKTTKYIADFMAKEHEIHIDGEPDLTQMKGYNYLVLGDTVSKWTFTPPRYDFQLNVGVDSEVVTLQKIWQCLGSPLTGENGQQLKNICLSFALFRLLCRRFGGHPFLESSPDKTCRLVRQGLLSEQGDYKRAFKVIEVELSFLFDLFYTKYAVLFHTPGI